MIIAGSVFRDVKVNSPQFPLSDLAIERWNFYVDRYGIQGKALCIEPYYLFGEPNKVAVLKIVWLFGVWEQKQ